MEFSKGQRVLDYFSQPQPANGKAELSVRRAPKHIAVHPPPSICQEMAIPTRSG